MCHPSEGAASPGERKPCAITCRPRRRPSSPVTALVAEQGQRGGRACAQLIERLLADKMLERLRAAQGVIGLGKTYGNARLEAACARALAHDSPFYRTVKTILAPGDRPAAEPITPRAYGRTRFTRDAADLFASPPRSKTCCIDPRSKEKPS
jgi:hypothetical protein